ncbi:beta-hexosaminidase subunit beta-like [Varroa jacobsoni]|uniref:beta-hexosaminidase subunit beta-like n=1 Tax=Varroa jacobsoni TaxID=62625 RepID=UPI000BF8B8B6|nr:beta-hexosaminidase subunit beta-like [Varroa jacobsoni]
MEQQLLRATILGVVAIAFVCAHITYIEVRLPLEGTPSPPGSPWPMPQTYRPEPKQLQINPDTFDIRSDEICCDVIEKAIKRYKKVIFPLKQSPKPGNLPRLKVLHVEVTEFRNTAEDCGYPRHESNENYTLAVSESTGVAILKSATVWGALRGLETFSQLVYIEDQTNRYLINATIIEDWPRFKFRGILLDTSRHFQPVKIIKQNMDAMAMSKFNVFHWHLVDDQAWPYEMRVFPNLTQAAYHPSQVYSQQDIRDLIEYARERGIRIIPEIDTPGHTQAIGKIFPALLTPCYGNGGRGTPRYPDFAAYEMLNPTQEYTYNVLREIFNETFNTFPDEYLHLGMDEVYYKCWESSPEIAEFMKQHNFKEVSQVEQHYVRTTLHNVRKLGAKYMIWQDPIDNGVEAASDTLIGLWKDVSLDSKLRPWRHYMKDMVKHGYQIVLSAPWYLNYISYGQDWQKYYEVEPSDFEGTEAEKNLLTGGEACMWTEYVDATNLISRLWPRASAVGERLWSAASVNKTKDAAFRLDELRCRMIRRGIPAAPILNGYCGAYDWDVNRVS